MEKLPSLTMFTLPPSASMVEPPEMEILLTLTLLPSSIVTSPPKEDEKLP